MTHQTGNSGSIHSRISTSRMTPTERLDAAASLAHGEALGDWLSGLGRQMREALADLSRFLGKAPVSHSQLPYGKR